MNLSSKQLRSWLVFLGCSVFLMVLGNVGYQSLPKSILPLATQQHVLGDRDEQGFEVTQVKRIVDGDTIELADGRKVRYIGVDTPETKHPTKKQECFGQEASQRNQELVEGKTVKLEKDISETDRYGRLLRYVWVDDQLINLTLVKEGFAAASSYPPDIARQAEFRQAEQLAREAEVGLWHSCPVN